MTYNFQDMRGQKIAGVEVLRRLPNVDGNACWRVEVTSCGHLDSVLGTRLRLLAKDGKLYQCDACRPKRPGTVRRR